MDKQQSTQARLGTVTPFPVVNPGFRLVPATVGRTGRTQVTVWIECPTYCTVDHVAEPEGSIEDIAHQGEDFGIVAPSMTGGSSEVELYARLYSDPASPDPRMRGPHLLIGNGLTPDAQMTAADAERWLGELIDFTAQLRHAVQACRSGVDTDETMRRVGGAA
jgi:hypothetical protein